MKMSLSLYLLILSQYYRQSMFALDDQQAIQSVITPHQTSQYTRNMSTDRKFSDRRQKRTPIFSQNKLRKSANLVFLGSTMTRDAQNRKSEHNSYFSFLDQTKVINYDSCGCQNKTSTCQTIVNAFSMQSNSIKQMRRLYTQQFQRMEKRHNNIDIQYKRKLFRLLPKWYPELFYSHLNNLIQVIQLKKIGFAEFECLAAIQYHAKIEYLTYFLYNDMKKSFNNKQKFYLDTEKELQKQATNFRKIRFYFNEESLADTLETFINEYYDSVGANIVPYQYFAKFLAELSRKGSRYLSKFLSDFIVLRCNELKKGLKLIRIKQIQMYKNYMRELNFQQFIKQT